MAVACLSFIFYLLNSFFSFFPYREFKAIELMENPMFSEIMVNSDGERNPENRNVSNETPIQYNLDYGNNAPQGDSKPKGTFEVFKGQGVLIG
jgi:hypothetical protein